MRIEVLTTLYPGPPRPFEGVFAERRWLGMRERGHEVHVTHPLPLAPGPFLFGRWAEIKKMPRHEVRGGIPVYRPRYLHIPGRPNFNAARFARVAVRSIESRERPDVVVIDYAWPASCAVPALVERGIPCVVNGRGSDVLQVSGEAGLGEELAENLRAAGHWCAVSRDLVETMDRLAGREGHGKLVPNGVDLELFTVRDRAEARRELGLELEGPLVLVAGHLIERKDPLLALEVFERGAPAEAHLAFVGRGRLRPQLEAKIRQRKLTRRVSIVGEVPPGGLARWYAAADLLLLTSRREGRPNVVIEALASGRPVLATPAGGTAELLAGFDGMLSETREAGELAPLLGRLLRESPAPEVLRASVEPLSWANGLARLEEVLEEARAVRA